MKGLFGEDLPLPKPKFVIEMKNEKICECGHEEEEHKAFGGSCGCLMKGCPCKKFKPKKQKALRGRIEDGKI